MIRSLKIVSFLAAALGFVGTSVGYEAAFKRWPPLAMLNDGGRAYLPPSDVETCFKVRAMILVGDPGSVRFWPVCRRWLAQARALAAFDLRFKLVTGSGALGLAALFLFAFCVRVERPAAKVIRGPRLRAGDDGVSAFAKACNRECRSFGPGIELLPRIAFSRERETRHFLVLGSVGAGKTQTMLRMILQAKARGDGVLVLDTKGDMMATLPSDGEPLLVAPHDQRSLVWDIAADCETPQDARELAARLIPPSHDPMWSQAAEELFFACIVHLQQTKGRRWTWGDLKAVVTADPATLKGHVQRHSPGALRHLDQPDNKTTLSILTTFQTHMRIVSVLAESWSDAKAERFSIRSWLKSPSPYRPLILQHDTRYPALSAIWIGSLLSLSRRPSEALRSPTAQRGASGSFSTSSRNCRRSGIFRGSWSLAAPRASLSSSAHRTRRRFGPSMAATRPSPGSAWLAPRSSRALTPAPARKTFRVSSAIRRRSAAPGARRMRTARAASPSLFTGRCAAR